MTSRTSDPNRPPDQPTDDEEWDDVINEMKTRPKGGQTLPGGVAMAPGRVSQPSVLEPAVVEIEGKPREMMESAIELDDDALLEYEEEEEEAPPQPAAKSTTIIRASVAPRPEAPAPGLRAHDDALVAELARRADALGGDEDPVARSRARMELGLVLEALVGDRAAALLQYRAAHEAAPSASAPITAARWLTPQRPIGAALSLALSHARVARDDESRVERWLEVARLHQVAGDLAAADKAYGQALAIAPTYPAGLRGREGLLHALSRSDARGALVSFCAHLETMASAWVEDPPLAAWLHVERAASLDRLGRHDAARAALESAMHADGQAPSVRAAYTQHLLVHRATEALVNAWSEHARDDQDRARGARFEFAAARLASERLDDLNLAVALHARAAERGEADVEVRRDALLELARLHATLGNPRASTDARERHLALIEEPRRRAHEHRRLSETFELLGHHEDVVRHTTELLRLDPDDTDARERLDRSLEALGLHEERVAVWTGEAARGGAPTSRGDCYVRAARIAESELHDPSRAESLFRAAWAADDGNFHAFEGLSRLLARPASSPGEVVAEHARARIDLYEQAVLTAPDGERRIAYLEKVAQIWEDELNQPARALEVYRRVEQLAPKRRSAIVGAQRNAARASDQDELLRALIREADLTDDVALQRTLLLRAADVAAESLNDADTALSLIERVLSRSPGDPLGLRAAWKISYKTGQFEAALERLGLLLKHTRRGPAAFALCIERAVLLEEKLRRPADAVQAYREAASHEPEHPVPQLEIPRLLVTMGEHRKAADALVALAGDTANPYVRARLLLHAASLYDDRLDLLDPALIALTQAHALVPADEMIFERLLRVQQRRGKPGELVPFLEKRIAATTGDARVALQLQLAILQSSERDHLRASALLREVLSAQPRLVAAYRTLEYALRRLDRWDELAALLREQASQASVPGVRLAALWESSFLEQQFEAINPAGPGDTLEQIRRDLPEAASVHEALVRLGGLAGVPGVIPTNIAHALAAVAASSENDGFLAATLHLATALVFQRAIEADGSSAVSFALPHYRACLQHWPDSLAAARGLLEAAHLAGDTQAQVEANTILGRIETAPKARAAHLAAAAAAVSSEGEDGIASALDLYAKALADDPDAASAARGLIALADAGADPGRVADVLRSTLERVLDNEQVVLVGGALGRIARDTLRDPNGAVEALRRVRDKAPGHVPTLLALAEACASLHLWFESAEVARSVLGISNDRREHLSALVCLAEAHAHVRAKWADARREAVDAELAAESVPLLERRSVIVRLSAVYAEIGEPGEQERLICMDIAIAGDDPEPLRRLAARYDLNAVDGCIGYIQALNRVMAMCDVFETPHQPAWLVELGRLEATKLSRPREGIVKLRDAIKLDPSRLDSSFALADTLAAIGAHEEAANELRSLLGSTDPSILTAEKVATFAAMAMRELAVIGRGHQATVAEELMGYLGYGAPERIKTFRGRLLPEHLPTAYAFDRTTLERSLLPAVGQGVLLHIAGALEEVSHKLLRIEPSDLGAASQLRLNARSSHPRRALADQYARAFGQVAFDLYVDVPSLTSPRVLPGSPASILLPIGFDKLPRNEQGVGLARLVASVALGVPWLEELSNDDLEGWIFGALHVGRPGWDSGALSASRDAMASTWRPLIAKAISRKTRKLLDELAEDARLDMDPVAWRHALRLATWRCAYVTSGDWTATVDHAWRLDGEVARTPREKIATAIFSNSILRDIVLYGLSAETTPLLRAAGHV